MGNGVSSEEERYWEQACRRVLFDFEINNAEFAEYGGSWKLLHDDIVQEEAELTALVAVLRAELERRRSLIASAAAGEVPGVNATPRDLNNSLLATPMTELQYQHDLAMINSLECRLGRILLLEFKYIALAQIDNALDLAREILLALQRGNIEYVQKHGRMAINLEVSHLEFSAAFNPEARSNGNLRQLVETVLDELPDRYYISDKLKFTRSRARGFDSIEVCLPWLGLSPGQLILTIDCKPTEGPPGFGGRVPAVILSWKSRIQNDNPLDPINYKSTSMWIVTGMQLVPVHRYILIHCLEVEVFSLTNVHYPTSRPKTTTLSLQLSNPIGGSFGTPPPQPRKRRSSSTHNTSPPGVHAGNNDVQTSHSPQNSHSESRLHSPPSSPSDNTKSPSHHPPSPQRLQPPQSHHAVGQLRSDKVFHRRRKSADNVPAARKSLTPILSTSTTPLPSPSSPTPPTSPSSPTSPIRKPLVEYTHYFLDNNVLVSLARGDSRTVSWASRYRGQLYCTEIARDEHLSCGRVSLPSVVILVHSEVDCDAQERAIRRILSALNLTGNTAEKLKPDLRYLIQASWACWDAKLGIPYDAKVAFITFDMKFWRRLLQHEEKLRLIETIINDEGLDHLIDVACAQDYIGREPSPPDGEDAPPIIQSSDKGMTETDTADVDPGDRV